jgi:hypothetical protein
MTQQENGFVWPLVSETAGVQLQWHKLGSATWLDGVASFPRGPDEPGVYLVKLAARGRYRIYIGEAANLRKRLRRYGGHGTERPIERGRTTTNMRVASGASCGRMSEASRCTSSSFRPTQDMHCARIILLARIAG